MATPAQKERQIKAEIKEMVNSMDVMELLRLTEQLDKRILASVLQKALEQMLLEKGS